MTYTKEWCECVARIVHEANRAYCTTLGDTSQPAWDEAPEWQRMSAINGVYFALEYKRTPQELHENWMREKTIEGWKYGVKKDAFEKTHPCMVPYDQLPEPQQRKDKLFLAIVDTFRQVTPKASASVKED